MGKHGPLMWNVYGTNITTMYNVLAECTCYTISSVNLLPLVNYCFIAVIIDHGLIDGTA